MSRSKTCRSSLFKMKYEIFESIDLLIFRRNQKTYSLYVVEKILLKMSPISLEPYKRKPIARGMEPSLTESNRGLV